MIDAIKAEQRAGLLQFALSPRCGREAEGADTGQVAHARNRGADLGALAKGCNARGVFVGVTAEGVGGIGAKTQGDAVRGSKAETLRRLLGKKSDRVTLDKGGRICLPDAMAKAAAIGKEA